MKSANILKLLIFSFFLTFIYPFNTVAQCDNIVYLSPGDDIQEALNAVGYGGSVRLKVGTYKLTKPLEMPSGVSLEGGYNFTGYEYHWFTKEYFGYDEVNKTSEYGATTLHREYGTLINGVNNSKHMIAIMASNASDFMIQDLKITTINHHSAGGTTYGIHLNNCSNYRILRVGVEPGNARKGWDGSRGQKGGDGNPGNNGGPSTYAQSNTATWDDGDLADNEYGYGYGGIGGTAYDAPTLNPFNFPFYEGQGSHFYGLPGFIGSSSTVETRGGNGGGGGHAGGFQWDIEWLGITEWVGSSVGGKGGNGGGGAVGGKGGAGSDCPSVAANWGYPAQPGTTGSPGTNGKVGSIGSAPAYGTYFVPGGQGSSGSYGTGGGGGGGAAGYPGWSEKDRCNVTLEWRMDDIGYGPGGGGAGGNGGLGGTGAYGGGGSFGIYIFNNGAQGVVEDCYIISGQAGMAGTAGPGGNPGNGGMGGINVDAPQSDQVGGFGGKGGFGGVGGDGGSSHTGWAQAVVLVNSNANPLSISESNFDLKNQEVINVDAKPCLNQDMKFTTFNASAEWDFSLSSGATISALSGDTVAIQYQTTGRKTLATENGAYVYTDFIKITCESSFNDLGTIKICDRYYSPDGTLLSEPGDYVQTLRNSTGCDSVVTFQLEVNSGGVSIEDTVYACDSWYPPEGAFAEESWPITTTRSITWYIHLANGCIQTHYTQIYISNDQPSVSSIDTTACGLYIAPDGQEYTGPGTYFAIIPNAAGCDSTISINLMMTSPVTVQYNLTECESFVSPGGVLYLESSRIVETFPNSSGCDSTIIIDLTILPKTIETSTIVSCEPFVSPISGKIYNETGLYTDTSYYPGTDCYSLEIFDLTITHSHSEISVDECHSYTLPSGTQTLHSSGTYIDIIPNAAGCDSIITIDLNLNESYNNISVVATGGIYTVPSGDEVYTSAGIYFDTITNMAGCDSILLINLSFTPVSVEPNNAFYNVSVFPNPSVHLLYIEVPEFLIGNKYSLSDISGKLVQQGILIDLSTSCDVSSLENGIYFIIIEQLDEPIKCIKQ